MKQPDLHPEAEFEIGEALAYYRYNARANIADDLDARIETALVEISGHPRRFPIWDARSPAGTSFLAFLT